MVALPVGACPSSWKLNPQFPSADAETVSARKAAPVPIRYAPVKSSTKERILIISDLFIGSVHSTFFDII